MAQHGDAKARAGAAHGDGTERINVAGGDLKRLTGREFDRATGHGEEVIDHDDAVEAELLRGLTPINGPTTIEKLDAAFDLGPRESERRPVGLCTAFGEVRREGGSKSRITRTRALPDRRQRDLAVIDARNREADVGAARVTHQNRLLAHGRNLRGGEPSRQHTSLIVL